MSYQIYFTRRKKTKDRNRKGSKMNSESERIVNYTIKGRSKLDLATLARARMYHQDTDILSSHVFAEVVLASTQRKKNSKSNREFTCTGFKNVHGEVSSFTPYSRRGRRQAQCFQGKTCRTCLGGWYYQCT